MAIDNPQVDRLVRRLAAQTGETPEEALIRALQERIERHRPRSSRHKTREQIIAAAMEISRRCSALPDRDTRTADQILAYNASGSFE